MNRREFVNTLGIAAPAILADKGHKHDFFKIDAFCHFSSLEYFDLLLRSNGPNGAQGLLRLREVVRKIEELRDPRARIRAMDETDINISILTSQPFIEMAPQVSIDPVKAMEAARFINDYMAQVIDDNRHRFKWVAQLPVNLPSTPNNYALMIGELERCIANGAVGGCFVVSPTTKPPDHEDFIGNPSTGKLGLYGEAVRLKAPLWMHPARPPVFTDYTQLGPPLSKYNLYLTLGWPYDSSIAMAHIAFANAFGRYPELKIIVHHKGGLVHLLQNRLAQPLNLYYDIDTGVPDNISAPYLDHFKNFYVDTVFMGNSKSEMEIVKIAYDFFGPEKILFGTDAPYGARGGRDLIIEAKRSVEGLRVPRQRIEDIYSTNILKII